MSRSSRGRSRPRNTDGLATTFEICVALARAGANVEDAYIFSHPEAGTRDGFPLMVLLVTDPEEGATAFNYDAERQRYHTLAKLPFLTEAEYKTAIEVLKPAAGQA